MIIIDINNFLWYDYYALKNGLVFGFAAIFKAI